MSDFTNGLDDGFIRFSETPQALQKGRNIQIQSAVLIIAIQLFFVFIPVWPIRILLFILMWFVIALSWRRWVDWSTTPFAVNPSHPLMELLSDKEAKVMIRLHDGRWEPAGRYRYRLVEDDLLKGFNLVTLDNNYSIFGYLTAQKSQSSSLRRTIALLNQALGLRDAHNGERDDIEDARDRESKDFGLLDRDWPDEEDSQDALGPIAKKLKGQE
ncbi:hypothetical protein N9X28_00040 [Candidatus Poseidoniales archaeon]|nr:hypothetical protein [Candidatus Poseidoniales archaeon]MDC3316855.1 hypothetical protein [Candidatus Poseidoniaceae archaeon]